MTLAAPLAWTLWRPNALKSCPVLTCVKKIKQSMKRTNFPKNMIFLNKRDKWILWVLFLIGHVFILRSTIRLYSFFQIQTALSVVGKSLCASTLIYLCMSLFYILHIRLCVSSYFLVEYLFLRPTKTSDFFYSLFKVRRVMGVWLQHDKVIQLCSDLLVRLQ